MSENFYHAFEEKHRGSRELIKSRQRIYLPFILPLQSIYSVAKAIDLGCGRGEWLELLKESGFEITPGQMGENITTRGINLLDLPQNTLLHIGETAIVQVTGLRNPCNQLNGLQEGLMQAVLGRDEHHNLIRKAGIMGVVLKGGQINIGDSIAVHLPEPPFVALDRV